MSSTNHACVKSRVSTWGGVSSSYSLKRTRVPSPIRADNGNTTGLAFVHRELRCLIANEVAQSIFAINLSCSWSISGDFCRCSWLASFQSVRNAQYASQSSNAKASKLAVDQVVGDDVCLVFAVAQSLKALNCEGDSILRRNLLLSQHGGIDEADKGTGPEFLIPDLFCSNASRAPNAEKLHAVVTSESADLYVPEHVQ